MKTISQSAERLTSSRKFGILDTLVLMLAVSLFFAWILGTVYLSFFSSGTSANANSQTAALIDTGAENSSEGVSAMESNGSDDGTRAVNDGGGPDPSQVTGGGFNSSPIKTSSDFTSKEKTALERKISTLQKQLETKSQEVTRLQKASKESTDSKPKEAVDAAKYKSEISQLTKQKDRLDRDIKKLKDLSDTQKTKIQTLQDQLVAAVEANPVTAEATAEDANGMDPGLSGTPSQNQPLEFRDWISSRGNKARLAFVRWEGDEIVVVNEDNKKFRLALNRLSLKDQEYVNGKR